ncbi:MAG: riboflavin biosynthesis protein RibF [Planctomycetota bacterium]|nr:riboflavin biosynthesis protein RibF [Planctomycetota bacterium]
MQVLTDSIKPFNTRRPVFLTIGMFDGMHLGHLELIRQLAFWARSVAGFTAVLTFDRHPRSTVSDYTPPLITPREQKLYILSRLGVDGVAELSFTREVAELSATQFLSDIVAGGLKARGVLLGFNNRFGKGGEGDFRLLRSLAPELGLKARQARGVWLGGVPISSTQIRNTVSEGNLSRAEFFLGRKFSIFGKVVHGKNLGNKLGYPTANLKLAQTLTPPPGIYSSITRVDNRFHASSTYITERDGMAEPGKPLVETHIMDFNEDIYGKFIEVVLIEFLRSDRKFADTDGLACQIKQDVQHSYVSACNVKI